MFERFVNDWVTFQFEFDALIGLRRRSEDRKPVESWRAIIAHQFKNRDPRVETGHAEMKGQRADVVIPDWNHGGSDQHAGIVRNRKTEECGEPFSDIAEYSECS